MSGFQAPTFGFSSNNPQSYGSPKSYHSPYQPMPLVGTPSFGGLGRPMTPKEPSRHSSYLAMEPVEPPVQIVQPSVERVRRHREYYLEGGDMYFLVENYLFRVHKYFFERESPVFRKKFADIAVSGNHRVGTSENDPLVLQEVRTDDFSRFLWVFYNPAYSIYDASAEDWAAILGLAHHWQFSEVKSLVVRELEKQIIPSIYKIVVYHRYGVDRGLLLPSYMDLISREETLSFEEAKDLGLETSLMIMTAREIVRKGEAPTSAVHVSPEELKNIIRHVFRFPGPRSDSPLSDTTAAEPAFDHRSPPLLAEKTDLPTVPEYEHEGEPIGFTASASLNSPLPPAIDTQVPAPTLITPNPTPPAPASSTPKNKASSKPTPATPEKEATKPTPAVLPKGEPKEEPAKPIFPKQKDGPKSSVQEPIKPTTAEPPKPEGQDDKKKPLLSRLTDLSKGANNSTPAKDAAPPKDKEGDKPASNKEAKDARGAIDEKDIDPLAPGQDPNGTPVGTPLLDTEPGTPSIGQSVLGKKAKTLLARAEKAKRRAAQEMDLSNNSKPTVKGTDPSSKGKETDPGSRDTDKETPRESLKAPSTINPATLSRAGSDLKGSVSGAKEVETKAGVDGKGKEVAGDEKDQGKPTEVSDANIPKGGMKTDGPGDEKRADVKQDTKKPGGATDSSDNIAPAVTTNETTKPVADDAKVIPPAATTKKPNDPEVPSVVVDAATKKEADPAVKGKVESVIADEGDIATPKRATKELPASPAKSIKDKAVPTLGLTVPKSPKDGLAPLTATTVVGSISSPLQKVLEDTEDETLMERMARLHVGDVDYQPPKDIVPPAPTDLESEFECETAPSGPSTPRSRAGRGSFSFMLRSEVPLSDDDEFFVDCGSNASVSHIDGV